MQKGRRWGPLVQKRDGAPAVVCGVPPARKQPHSDAASLTHQAPLGQCSPTRVAPPATQHLCSAPALRSTRGVHGLVPSRGGGVMPAPWQWDGGGRRLERTSRGDPGLGTTPW